MSLFRVYIAVSLDGYIATTDGGVEWLEVYPMDEFDQSSFFKSIAVTVMGRTTFDQTLARGGWPYKKGERVVVLTHRPIESPPSGVEMFGGEVTALAERLRHEIAEGRGAKKPRATTQAQDVWLMGGADSIHAFHEAGVIDRWEIFIAPVLLGDGIPLFPRHPAGLSQMRLTHSRQYEKSGFVEVWYEPKR